MQKSDFRTSEVRHRRVAGVGELRLPAFCVVFGPPVPPETSRAEDWGSWTERHAEKLPPEFLLDLEPLTVVVAVGCSAAEDGWARVRTVDKWGLVVKAAGSESYASLPPAHTVFSIRRLDETGAPVLPLLLLHGIFAPDEDSLEACTSSG